MVNEGFVLQVGVAVHSPRNHFLGNAQLPGVIRPGTGDEILVRCHRHMSVGGTVDATFRYDTASINRPLYRIGRQWVAVASTVKPRDRAPESGGIQGCGETHP